jgi:23S rRNA pseudouridine2605 synthase
MNSTDPDPKPPVIPAAPSEQPAAEATRAAGGDAATPDASAGSSAQGPAADGAGEAPRRRNRNRRRGRRNRGDRPVAGESVAAGDAMAAGDADLGFDDDGDDDIDAQAGDDEPAALEWTPVEVGERFADVVSGAYDDEPAPEPESEPTKRVLAAMPDAPKLHKVLAQAGIGSRRDMEQLIADGQITVNGQPAHIGQRIAAGDQIRVNGQPVKVRITPPPARVLAYHKPAGEIVTHGDPQNRPTVFRRLPRLHQGKWQSVGRLDINTEGLLLFTNSGDLANRLMHPRFGVEREYAVRVLGTLDDEQRERLLEGIEIDGQRAAMRSIEDGGGEGANHWYRVVISEGRNREVRRIFESVGLTVSRLIRIRYGAIQLPRSLARGRYHELAPEWVEAWVHDLGIGIDEVRQRQGGGQQSGKSRNRSGQGKGRPGRPGFGPGQGAGQPGYPSGFGQGFGPGQGGQGRGKGKPQNRPPKQPDPMTSSVTYIAAGHGLPNNGRPARFRRGKPNRSF